MSLIETLREPWHPVTRPALAGWLVFYALFLVYLYSGHGQLQAIDNVNLVVHEAGHALLGWFGERLGIAGGTIFQLLVPLALAASFAWKRQLPGTAFCLFMLFQNFLGIAVYVADARAMELDLVSIGGGDIIEHDWNLMLSWWGLLHRDRELAALVRLLGWVGMLATVGGLAWRALFTAEEKGRAAGAV